MRLRFSNDPPCLDHRFDQAGTADSHGFSRKEQAVVGVSITIGELGGELEIV